MSSKLQYAAHPGPLQKPFSHYYKDVSCLDTLDVYGVCQLFEVVDSSGALQHAIKKLLVAGNRGAKDRTKDLEEAIATLQRLLELEKHNASV